VKNNLSGVTIWRRGATRSERRERECARNRKEDRMSARQLSGKC